jgi:hypothetical protein
MNNKRWQYCGAKLMRADRPIYYLKPVSDEEFSELQKNSMAIIAYKMWREEQYREDYHPCYAD